MSPLRIVTVLNEPPLPFGGAAARWYYVLLRGLAARGHRLTVFCCHANAQDEEATRDLYAGPDYDVRTFAYAGQNGLKGKWDSFRRPFSTTHSYALQSALQIQLSKGFDILHMEQLWTGWLGLPFSRRATVNVHYSMERDLANQPAASTKDWLVRQRARQSERYLLRQYPVICCLTEPLQEYIQALSPRSKVHTVPLGIDTSLYEYREKPECGEPVVGLIGNFNWFPSIDAGRRLLERLWPAIQAQVPQAKLMIAGRRARQAFSEHVERKNIEIYEDVPDILPYFRRLDVLLYSADGASGTKVKVQEAFALGIPVVTTPSGVEGLPTVNGVHAAVENSDDGLVAATVALLRDPKRRGGYRQAARSFIEKVCGPEPSVSRMEQVFQSVSAKQ